MAPPAAGRLESSPARGRLFLTCVHTPSYFFTPPPPQVTEGRRSLSTFLTGLCAIVGGVFTVAGMLDSCLFRLGKLSGSP
jgi:hypothetical protein